MKKKRVFRIEQWYIIAYHLYGKIYGNPKIPEGKEVRTSTIVTRYEYGGRKYIETENAVFELGKKRVPTKEEAMIS